jgi:hypothetical protein
MGLFRYHNPGRCAEVGAREAPTLPCCAWFSPLQRRHKLFVGLIWSIPLGVLAPACDESHETAISSEGPWPSGHEVSLIERPVHGPAAEHSGSAVMSAQPDASHIEEELSNAEFLPVPLPKAAFAWVNEETFSSNESAVESSTLHGTLTNLTDAPLTVEAYAAADAGSNQTLKRPTWLLELPASSIVEVEFPLEEFGFDFGVQRFSGRISLKFRLFGKGEDSGGYESLYASELYYHPQGESFVVYGAEALRSVHHAGDYASRENISPEPGTVIDRVVDGTRVDYSPSPRTAEQVIAEGDDAAPGDGGAL